MESGIIFDNENPSITPANKIRGDVLSLCSPLLDVQDGPGGIVEFVHFTVYEYDFVIANTKVTKQADFTADTFENPLWVSEILVWVSVLHTVCY